MTYSVEAIVQQIDSLHKEYDYIIQNSKYDDLSDLKSPIVSEAITRINAAIMRLSPSGSAHREGAELLMKQYGITTPYSIAPHLGILKALRADYIAGYMASVEELIHADVFADFLEMAEHLLSQGYKDPAAVMSGSVLEEHLRKLCKKNGIETLNGTANKKADLLNAELASGSVYSKLDQKSITAWLDLRNKAAHGQYGEYSRGQTQLMLDGVRNFMSRYIA